MCNRRAKVGADNYREPLVTASISTSGTFGEVRQDQIEDLPLSTWRR